MYSNVFGVFKNTLKKNISNENTLTLLKIEGALGLDQRANIRCKMKHTCTFSCGKFQNHCRYHCHSLLVALVDVDYSSGFHQFESLEIFEIERITNYCFHHTSVNIT